MSVNEFELEELLCLLRLISCINSKPPTFWHATVSKAINGDIPNYICEFRWEINCQDRRYVKQQSRLFSCWYFLFGAGRKKSKKQQQQQKTTEKPETLSLTIWKCDDFQGFLCVVCSHFIVLFTFHLPVLVFIALRK